MEVIIEEVPQEAMEVDISGARAADVASLSSGVAAMDIGLSVGSGTSAASASMLVHAGPPPVSGLMPLSGAPVAELLPRAKSSVAEPSPTTPTLAPAPLPAGASVAKAVTFAMQEVELRPAVEAAEGVYGSCPG